MVRTLCTKKTVVETIEQFAEIVEIAYTKYTHDKLTIQFQKIKGCTYYHDDEPIGIDRYIYETRIPMGHSFMYSEKRQTIKDLSICYGVPLTKGYHQNHLLPVQNKKLKVVARTRHHLFVYDPVEQPNLGYIYTKRAPKKPPDFRQVLVNLLHGK